jgi:hypothetical protein
MLLPPSSAVDCKRYRAAGGSINPQKHRLLAAYDAPAQCPVHGVQLRVARLFACQNSSGPGCPYDAARLTSGAPRKGTGPAGTR